MTLMLAQRKREKRYAGGSQSGNRSLSGEIPCKVQ